jgi:predicted acylesterase/phospholipase RssA
MHPFIPTFIFHYLTLPPPPPPPPPLPPPPLPPLRPPHFYYQIAFDQTGRIINITVAPINNYDPPRLLNYLTAPHVCVWSAACASCAVPGLFDSITLMIKG